MRMLITNGVCIYEFYFLEIATLVRIFDGFDEIDDTCILEPLCFVSLYYTKPMFNEIILPRL